MRVSTRKTMRDYGAAILAAVFVALLIRFFVIEAYRIPTAAMRPTLEPGDTIFVAKWPFGLRFPGAHAPFVRGRAPERGEVVVFSMPDDAGREYIKRVIGLAGDTVEVSKGHVLLNGRRIDLPHPANETCAKERIGAGRAAPTYGVCWEPPLVEDFAPAKVPDGQVFVLGDYRSQPPAEATLPEAERRRTWGMVPVEDVKGKALWVWLSVEPRFQGMSSAWFPKFRFERMFRRIK